MDLTAEQHQLLELPLSSKLFLSGPAGTGKTTAGTLWLKKLLHAGIPAHQILVFTPQRALAEPYEAVLWDETELSNSLLTTMTLGGLARRMVDLFWPAISRKTSVAHPDRPPHFLTLETAQYYMAHIVRQLIESEGYFESLTINRNRIYSQILDNLNKAAIVGFPINEIGSRLKAAWIGELDQHHIYDDAQDCIIKFRSFCLENNLLDFSLQVEIFIQHLWSADLCRNYLTKAYRHLIVDNVEEDTPVTHDILRQWLPDLDSALVIFDDDAGYRFFLGADVQTAYSLRKSCEQTLTFQGNLINPPEIVHLKQGIQTTIEKLIGSADSSRNSTFEKAADALVTPEDQPRYFPEMVDWVAGQVRRLIKEGTPPGQIVILAPFMSDVLRFALSNRLETFGIPHHSHRPSRSLRDEPATQTLLTFATLAFPLWGLLPKRINLAFALMHVIDGLDLVRAQLLTAYIYDDRTNGFPLSPFEEVPSQIRERVTYHIGERYDRLREWLAAVKPEEALTLDFFLSRLFGEVLSQPGYSFHRDLDNASTVARLIESVQKFRQATETPLNVESFSIGEEYVRMVANGVIAAQYIPSRDQQESNSVFLAPAYTFLIRNQPVDIQFWLDIGSPGWYQRLDQPLTQPYVLSRNWEKGEVWDTEDELAAAHSTLRRLSLGLLSRCRRKIYLGMSELDVGGFENRGLLLRIFQQVLLEARKGIS